MRPMCESITDCVYGHCVSEQCDALSDVQNERKPRILLLWERTYNSDSAIVLENKKLYGTIHRKNMPLIPYS